jgi:hypothetical protein
MTEPRSILLFVHRICSRAVFRPDAFRKPQREAGAKVRHKLSLAQCNKFDAAQHQVTGSSARCGTEYAVRKVLSALGARFCRRRPGLSELAQQVHHRIEAQCTKPGFGIQEGSGAVTQADAGAPVE